MEIKSAVFLKSSARVDQCPPGSMPEYAFIGRSNVGKSSLINMLLAKKDLAKTSQIPGKTQLINHFLVNNSFHVVDLPGYGYTSTGKKSRELFSQMIGEYVKLRPQLTLLFILLDIRHAPQKIDLAFIDKMGEEEVPIALIFTKADKISRSAGAASVARYKEELLQRWEELPPIFVTSSEKKIGRDELLDYIQEINHSLDPRNNPSDVGDNPSELRENPWDAPQDPSDVGETPSAHS